MGVAFSPSGEFFASVGADEQVHIPLPQVESQTQTHAHCVFILFHTQVLVWKTNFDTVDYQEGNFASLSPFHSYGGNASPSHGY